MKGLQGIESANQIHLKRLSRKHFNHNTTQVLHIASYNVYRTEAHNLHPITRSSELQISYGFKLFGKDQ